MKAFLVTNIQLGICTVIGAENSHHASNKATKLWKKYWDNIEPIGDSKFLYPQFVSIKDFNKQIKKLSETTI